MQTAANKNAGFLTLFFGIDDRALFISVINCNMLCNSDQFLGLRTCLLYVETKRGESHHNRLGRSLDTDTLGPCQNI